MKLKELKVLTVLAAAGLAACGGGGSTTASTESVSLSGLIAKGPAVGAKIKVYSVKDGVKDRLIGEGTSGAGGSYNIIIPRPDGPVLMEADLEGADIEDEAQPGVTYKGKTGDFLRATVTPAEDKAALTVHVTPFSHMAASVVLQGSLTKENIDAATAVVRQILNNTDFISENPVSNANLREQLKELSEQARDDNGDSNIKNLLDRMEKAVKKSDSGFGVTGSYLDDLCGNPTSSESGDACRGKFSDAITPVAPGEALSEVETARRLFLSLYDTVRGLSNSNPASGLNVAASKLATSADAAMAAVDANQIELMSVTAKNLHWLDTYKNSGDTTSINPNSGWVARGVLGQDHIQCKLLALANLAPDFSFTSETAAITLAPETANAVICTWVNTNRLVGSLEHTAGQYVNPYIRNQFLIFPGETPQNAYFASRVLVVDSNQTPKPSFTWGGWRSVKHGSVGITETATSKRFKFEGHLAPSASLVRRSQWTDFDHHEVNIDLTVNGTTTLGNFTPSSVTFSPNGGIRLVKKDGSVASLIEVLEGELSETQLKIAVGAQVPGLRLVGNFQASTTSATIREATFTGTVLEDQDLSGTYRKLLEGAIRARQTGESTGDITLSGTLSLKDRQPLGISLTGQQTGPGQSIATGTFFWNGKSFTLAESANGVRVSNSDGVGFTLTQPLTKAIIWVGDTDVGEINTNGRVTFKDGSFFQF